MKINKSKTNAPEPAIVTCPDEKSAETAEIMRQFNNVFLSHDPSEV